MNLVNQTRFGGRYAAQENKGNCFQACVATVLQMPLEEAFDCLLYSEENWFEEFIKWLSKYNLGCIHIECSEERPIYVSELVGIHIAICESETLCDNEKHVVVIQDYELLHDPNPHAKSQGKVIGLYIFVPLLAYMLVRKK